MCGGPRQTRYVFETRDGPVRKAKTNDCGVPWFRISCDRINEWTEGRLASQKPEGTWIGVVQQSGTRLLFEIPNVPPKGKPRSNRELLMTITVGATSEIVDVRQLVMNGGYHPPRMNCRAEGYVRPRNSRRGSGGPQLWTDKADDDGAIAK